MWTVVDVILARAKARDSRSSSLANTEGDYQSKQKFMQAGGLIWTDTVSRNEWQKPRDSVTSSGTKFEESNAWCSWKPNESSKHVENKEKRHALRCLQICFRHHGIKTLIFQWFMTPLTPLLGIVHQLFDISSVEMAPWTTTTPRWALLPQHSQGEVARCEESPGNWGNQGILV